jgi:hypothetical protein
MLAGGWGGAIVTKDLKKNTELTKFNTVPSKQVMSSPFLHKTISFSESCVGDLMFYVATKFNNKMYQTLVWPFLAFANI